MIAAIGDGTSFAVVNDGVAFFILLEYSITQLLHDADIAAETVA